MKHQRKWIGSVKSSLGCRGGDACLRISTEDVKNATKRGRWWISGAAWRSSSGSMDSGGEKPSIQLKSNDAEELLLQKLASKMRMNTSVRKSIFMVVCGTNMCYYNPPLGCDECKKRQ